ncbi:MAG: hypothetical protein ACT4QE_24985 [Anaerolineales bacterium]
MSLSYALEKLNVALHGLATGRGAIMERLREVYNDSGLLMVDKNDVPAELLDDIELVKEGLKRLQVSTSAMSEEDAVKLAEKIFNLYREVVRKAN